MVARVELRVDVSENLPFEARLETAVTVLVPEPRLGSGTTPVVFTFSGATYGRAYFDFHVPGYDGYSFADHLAEQGFIVAVCEHVGIGDSTPHEPFRELTHSVVVDADQATTAAVLGRLRAGDLVDGLAPVEDPVAIGVGHSMGGNLLIHHQDRHRSFDAVAVLGSTVVTEPPVADATNLGEAWREAPDPTWPPRRIFHELFHDDGVPADVIAADDALVVRVYAWMFDRVEDWGRSALASVNAAAGRIDVPVFLGFGSRDGSPDPHGEVRAYAASPDVTMFVLPNSAHCFNFAATRAQFLDRFAGWARSVAAARPVSQASGV